MYVVKIKYSPKSIFDKGKKSFRIDASDEEQSKEKAKKHPLFPKDGSYRICKV